MTRIALFGCGRIGTVHAESVTANPRAELAWVCDPMEGPAKELAARHGAQATADVATVLADDGVDAVIIASPTSTHVDLLVRPSGRARPCCARSRSTSTSRGSTRAGRRSRRSSHA